MSDLPDDEEAEDISNIILYEIGRTYKNINDKSISKRTESAIKHSLVLLEQLNSPKALEAVLEQKLMLYLIQAASIQLYVTAANLY